MITTNKWGECYFKILPPDMKEPKPPHYQWRVGENILITQDTNYNNTFDCFLGEIRLSGAVRLYPFGMLKVCWIGLPKSSVVANDDIFVKSIKAVIYQVKTGEELRKEDSPLYRMYVSRMVICAILRESKKIYTQCNEFDWTLFILYNHDMVDIEAIPTVYRASKYICIAAQLVMPGNTLFVVKDESVVKSLKQFGSIRDTIGWSQHFTYFYGSSGSPSLLNQVYHPKPVVAQRNLINWIVRAYNRQYNTDYSIPL